jgi:hypothetical protein
MRRGAPEPDGDFAAASRRDGWQRQFTRQAAYPAEESSARHLRFRRHQATAHAFLPQQPETEFPGSGTRGTDLGSSFCSTLALFCDPLRCSPLSRCSRRRLHASESRVNARVCNAIGMRELPVKHILHLRMHFRAT